MQKKLFYLMSLVLLTGCATSDIVQVNDEYRILKEGGSMLFGEFRLLGLKADGLKEANETCLSQKKSVSVIEEVSVPVSIGVFARYELTFKCE